MIRLRLRLILALLVAALWSDIFALATWKKALAAFKALFGLLKVEDQAPEALYHGRLDCCARCPIWVPGLRTCGKPFGRDKDLGCRCYMPEKAKSLLAECWLDEQGVESASSWRANGVA